MDFLDFRELASAKINRLMCKSDLYQRPVNTHPDIVTVRNVKRH